MLLAIDIGNSSIKLGIFDRNRVTSKFSIPTKRDYTAGEIAERVGNRVNVSIESAILCSVVPETDAAVSEYISHSLHIEPRFVKNTDDFGLKFRFPVEFTGTDRLLNSFAAVEKHGVPCIVISFGTATTIDVVNSRREYLGGVIAPGMRTAVKALGSLTSKLPEVEIKKPDRVIGTTTEEAIQSGVIHGHIAMIEGLLKQVISELGENPKIVATGGLAEIVAIDVDQVDLLDNDLTLDGLRLMNDRIAGSTTV